MSDSATTPPKPPSKLGSLGIKAGLALALALVIFLIGLFVGRGPVGDLRDRAEAAESSLALMQDSQHMTEATMLLYRTALDLDARNFGTANNRLDEAASALDRVGIAGSELVSLRESVAMLDINVAEDLAGQRLVVLGFAERLQGLMPTFEAPVDSL